MKKAILALLFVLAGVGLFAQTGLLRDLSGTVELKVPGAASYVAAKVGDKLTQDTIISTGFKSTALVELGSAVITVRPLTRLTLTEIRASQGSETVNVNIQTGRVRVDVSPPAGTKTAMSISSPIATASVRGTGFDFDTRNLKVNHGTVSFTGNKGMGRLVGAGSSSRVEDNGKAADPIQVRYADLQPPAPVGTDSNGSAAGTGAAKNSGGVITINLNYGSGGNNTTIDNPTIIEP